MKNNFYHTFIDQEKSQRSDPYTTQPSFQDIQRKDSKIQKQIICMASVHSIAPIANPIIPNDNNIFDNNIFDNNIFDNNICDAFEPLSQL